MVSLGDVVSAFIPGVDLDHRKWVVDEHGRLHRQSLRQRSTFLPTTEQSSGYREATEPETHVPISTKSERGSSSQSTSSGPSTTSDPSTSSRSDTQSSQSRSPFYHVGRGWLPESNTTLEEYVQERLAQERDEAYNGDDDEDKENEDEEDAEDEQKEKANIQAKQRPTWQFKSPNFGPPKYTLVDPAAGWGFANLQDKQACEKSLRARELKKWEFECLMKLGRCPAYEQQVRKRREQFDVRESAIATYQKWMANGWRPWKHMNGDKAKELCAYSTMVEAFGGLEDFEKVRREEGRLEVEEIAIYQAWIISGWRPWKFMTGHVAKEKGIHDSIVTAFGGLKEFERVRREDEER